MRIIIINVKQAKAAIHSLKFILRNYPMMKKQVERINHVIDELRKEIEGKEDDDVIFPPFILEVA